MSKILFFLIFISVNDAKALDFNYYSSHGRGNELVRLIVFSALTYAAYALDNTTNSNTTDIEATPYFLYWTIWLGNTYGIIDALGWTIDWLAAWWYYMKGESPMVKGLRAHLKSLENSEVSWHKAHLEAAANIIDATLNHLGEDHNNYKKEDVIRCIEIAKQILLQEAQKKAPLHVSIEI